MDNQILSLVMMDFAARRMENEQEEARRMEEITTLHPDLQALLQQRHSMVMKSVTSIFSGEVALDAEALMADYNQKISALLEKKGYPADYLAPVCQCKICQDAGYIYENSLKKPCECLKRPIWPPFPRPRKIPRWGSALRHLMKAVSRIRPFPAPM